MKLYIAEKPSLGRAIADALPKPQQKKEGYIQLPNGDCISWCIGHLLEQVPPEDYDPAYKKWRLEHLPITPEAWRLSPKKQTKKQLDVLKSLLRQADTIVHAGDPDREGQLLVDEVLSFLKVPASKRQTAQRCLISDLNPKAVTKALNNLRANSEFIPLSTSALARARADWLYGMNMTRASSVHGQQAGYKGVLSVGRVQTPLLGLVVKRDLEIAAFIPKSFFEVWATLQTIKGEKFRAKWQPSEACLPYQDEDGRVLSQGLADNVVSRVRGQDATVLTLQSKQKTQAPPLPYNLSALQIDAAKRFSLQAKQVLDTCQNLYEKHKLITYPRSDCRYLPSDHFSEAGLVCDAIIHNMPHCTEGVSGAKLTLKNKAWNDKKVSAHHAIIPTARRVKGNLLSQTEQSVYALICFQYLRQFYSAWVYQDKQVELDICGGLFVAKSRETISLGWKALHMPNTKKNDPKNVENNTQDEELQPSLPALAKHDTLTCMEAERCDKMTQAPKFFTDASLLAAMTGIARFVKDHNLRKILRDTDGLGTEATRAGIIELLFKRQYLERQGKRIVSTLAGKKLITALPEIATTPDMTARWESQLEQISHAQMDYKNFMGQLLAQLPQLIDSLQANDFQGLKGEGSFKFSRRYRAKKKTLGESPGVRKRPLKKITTKK